jgi:putative sterol carrier protein
MRKPRKSDDAHASKLDALLTTYLRGLAGVFQLHLIGPDGEILSSLYLELKQPPVITIGQGTHSKPDLTISVTEDKFIDLATGKLNPISAFMGGHVKVKGNMALAMKAHGVWAKTPGPKIARAALGMLPASKL